MALQKDVKKRQWRRKQRVRNRVRNMRSACPRINVCRSLNYIYGQVIDDDQQHTLASHSSLNVSDKSGTKSDVAYTVGKELAQKAIKNNVSSVIFDRGPYKYHGRVAAFAAGLREGGLQF